MVAAPGAPSVAIGRAPAAAAFDSAAASYDAEFSERPLGRWLRERVWEVLSHSFTAGQEVLELGCGTGEDAIWLARRGVRVLATDVSDAMLRLAEAKAAARGVSDRVRTARLDLNALVAFGAFDGALSNFGALNCVADRRALFRWLADRIRPGGTVVAVVMGPFCAWESGWFALHGDLGRAARRWRGGGTLAHVPGGDVRVWYPSTRTLIDEAEPYFRALRTMGIGTLLPPSYLAGLVDRFPRAFGVLRKLDGVVPFGCWWADHYLVVLERK